jgi:hypothetical protein
VTYWRILRFEHSDNGGSATVAAYKDKQTRDSDPTNYAFAKNMDVPKAQDPFTFSESEANAKKVIYRKLKTLAFFTGAVDVLELDQTA